MGLLESIAEDEKEIDALKEEQPQEDLENTEVESEEESQDESEEEENQEEEQDIPEKLDNEAYARLRREKAAAERERAALELRLKELESGKAETTKENQPSEEDYYLSEIIQEKKLNDARAHLASIENEFQKDVADYSDVVGEYARAVANAYRLNNPRASQDEIVKNVERSFIEKAASYYAKGLNPAEELYNDALSLGFKAQKKQEEDKKEDTKRKPDLDVIAKNKERSSNMAGGSRNSGGIPTKNYVIDMPLSEFSKIHPDELRRIERGE